MYHPGDGIRWVARYLDGDAAVWWRVMRQRITNYEEFRQAFIGKFWSNETQQKVRDHLEYGRFRPNGEISMSQYMEQMVLECRQLIPKMSDQQLIRKMARHFSKEIEIAVLTRGVKDICEFEQLLQEFQHIRTRFDNNAERRSNWQPNAEARVEREGGKQPFKRYDSYGQKAAMNENKNESVKGGFKKEHSLGNTTFVNKDISMPSSSKN